MDSDAAARRRLHAPGNRGRNAGMASMHVQDLMTSPVYTLGLLANVAEVNDLMRQRSIRHIPIVGSDGVLVGLVTHRDLLSKAFGGGPDLPTSIRRPYLRSIPVTEIMVTDVETIAPLLSLAEAASQIVDRPLGCLPVVEGGRVVGILTATDFVRHVAGSR